MIEAIKQDRLTRFADVPDHQLRIETAGTFENEEKSEQWRQLVQNAFPSIPVSYVDLPCSIACHVGINAAGTAIMKKEAMYTLKISCHPWVGWQLICFMGR